MLRKHLATHSHTNYRVYCKGKRGCSLSVLNICKLSSDFSKQHICFYHFFNNFFIAKRLSFETGIFI